MSDDPESPDPPHGMPAPAASAAPQPAADRPHPHAPIPDSIDPHWWDRLYGDREIERLLAMARQCHRARAYWEQPGWADIYRMLLIARADISDLLDRDPHSHLAREYARQIDFAIRGRH
jgi:hypothetical protein